MPQPDPVNLANPVILSKNPHSSHEACFGFYSFCECIFLNVSGIFTYPPWPTSRLLDTDGEKYQIVSLRGGLHRYGWGRRGLV